MILSCDNTGILHSFLPLIDFSLPLPLTALAHSAECRDLQHILLNQCLTSCVVTFLAPSRQLISVAISVFLFFAGAFSDSHCLGNKP